jgi:two-component sensor histidine kinase
LSGLYQVEYEVIVVLKKFKAHGVFQELVMSLHTVTVLHPEPVLRPSGEADHRIANSLTAISGLVRVRARAAGGVVDPKTFLLEIADRIDTVARLHLLLAYSNSGDVRLDQYLREICDRLGSALAMNTPVYSVDCPPEDLVPFNVALPLGLITAELFSNSLKYAHPTGLPVKISVSCSRTPTGELMLSYEDDGVGFPEGFDVASDGHLGMQFIRLLSEQLGGTHKWLSDPLGVQFALQVPCEK